ncbi:type II toxin-antitoxin system HicB family antitoxin [Candidatus Berkelbacteria bacterium]|nr:type II toxin-antitoxin system HicB family antitoxin [Candidatus Berkelbacteria bacterium]
MKASARVQRQRFTLVLQPEPEGGFTVTVPQLPGCVTYGRTLEEAEVMAAEAITGYLVSLKNHHEPVPAGGEPVITSLEVPSH